jgi:Reverse transcriptase (RNA-dependent DNA polymerase)
VKRNTPLRYTAKRHVDIRVKCHFNVKEKKKERRRQKRREKRRKDGKPPQLLYDSENEDEEEEISQEDGDRIFVAFIKPWKEINATQNVSQKLAEEALKNQPKKEFDELVPKDYHFFKDVFSKESFDELPPKKPWDHAIELKLGSEPHSTKVYPLAPNEQAQLDEFLTENLKSGRIRPSKSPMASPVFFIKKKDGSLRLVQDYRKLNEMTIKNSYPLPLISELVTKLRKAKWYTKLDVRWGYNNVRIKEGDEWKAAFRTSRGLFEPLVMFFGLTNSPATFQTMMNDLFKELIDEGVVSSTWMTFSFILKLWKNIGEQSRRYWRY